MNNLKVYEKNLKNKIGVITLSIILGATSLGLTGCAKKDTKETKPVTYTVEDANYERKVILNYPMGIETHATVNEDAVIEKYIDYSVIEGEQTSPELVYPLREIHFTSQELGDKDYKNMTVATFAHDNNIVIPNCYKWAEGYFGKKFSHSIGTIKYDIEELEGVYHNHYLSYEYTIKFKKSINLPTPVTYFEDNEFFEKYGEQKSIQKGDELKYKVLYRIVPTEDNRIVLQTIANEFEGMGEDSYNIKEQIKNNYTDAYKNITELGITESKEFGTFLEMNSYINKTEKNKSRK